MRSSGSRLIPFQMSPSHPSIPQSTLWWFRWKKSKVSYLTKEFWDCSREEEVSVLKEPLCSIFLLLDMLILRSGTSGNLRGYLLHYIAQCRNPLWRRFRGLLSLSSGGMLIPFACGDLAFPAWSMWKYSVLRSNLLYRSENCLPMTLTYWSYLSPFILGII